MIRIATAIWDENKDGWFVRIEHGDQVTDLLPPFISTYNGEPNESDDVIMDLIDEVIWWEARERPEKWQRGIKRKGDQEPTWMVRDKLGDRDIVIHQVEDSLILWEPSRVEGMAVLKRVYLGLNILGKTAGVYRVKGDPSRVGPHWLWYEAIVAEGVFVNEIFDIAEPHLQKIINFSKVTDNGDLIMEPQAEEAHRKVRYIVGKCNIHRKRMPIKIAEDYLKGKDERDLVINPNLTLDESVMYTKLKYGRNVVLVGVKPFLSRMYEEMLKETDVDAIRKVIEGAGFEFDMVNDGYHWPQFSGLVNGGSVFTKDTYTEIVDAIEEWKKERGRE